MLLLLLLNHNHYLDNKMATMTITLRNGTIILLETVTADLFVADDVYRAKDWPFLPSSIAFCSHSASAILRLSPYFLRFQWPFALRQSRTFGLCVWRSIDFGDVGGLRTWKKVYPGSGDMGCVVLVE